MAADRISPFDQRHPRLGAHMSIAGGYYRAVEAAARAGCDCVQVFTKNNNQWRGKPISADEASLFHETLARLGIRDPLSHASYLINLASPDGALHNKSILALADELRRASLLGIPYVVVHPGAYTTSSLDEGIAQTARAVREVLRATQELPTGLLLENTAGQGSTLGSQFGELATLLDAVGPSERCGVCIDTCHAFAAGYDLTSASGYRSMMDELDAVIGLRRVKAIHLNDSKKGLGSRVDRHEHIGHGEIGDAAFCRLLNDPRWIDVPMYLETEKGVHDNEDWDVINLRRLRACFIAKRNNKR